MGLFGRKKEETKKQETPTLAPAQEEFSGLGSLAGNVHDSEFSQFAVDSNLEAKSKEVSEKLKLENEAELNQLDEKMVKDITEHTVDFADTADDTKVEDDETLGDDIVYTSIAEQEVIPTTETEDVVEDVETVTPQDIENIGNRPEVDKLIDIIDNNEQKVTALNYDTKLAKKAINDINTSTDNVTIYNMLVEDETTLSKYRTNKYYSGYVNTLPTKLELPQGFNSLQIHLSIVQTALKGLRLEVNIPHTKVTKETKNKTYPTEITFTDVMDFFDNDAFNNEVANSRKLKAFKSMKQQAEFQLNIYDMVKNRNMRRAQVEAEIPTIVSEWEEFKEVSPNYQSREFVDLQFNTAKDSWRETDYQNFKDNAEYYSSEIDNEIQIIRNKYVEKATKERAMYINEVREGIAKFNTTYPLNIVMKANN